MPTTVAALLTCYNRKDKTLSCLTALFKQSIENAIVLDVYLVDDGSTDGTGVAIKEKFPQVKVIQGSGSLFWNGGMRKAFAVAMAHSYDYYLWLNDDTILYPNALVTLLQSAQLSSSGNNGASIIVGATQSAATSDTTYGGLVRSNRWHPLRFQLLEPNLEIQSCDTMNGNCVLIPCRVAEKIGNLESTFVHSMGDIDYGLRARKSGFQILLAPGYAGSCSANPFQRSSWEDPSLSIQERFKRALGPKGWPLRESLVLAKRHASLFWPVFWLSPYAKLILVSAFGR